MSQDSPFKLVGESRVNGRRFITAALMSAKRYLYPGSSLESDYATMVHRLRADVHEVDHVLDTVLNLRASQGRFAELKDRTDRLQASLDLLKQEEDSGEILLPTERPKRSARRQSAAQRPANMLRG